MRIVRVKPGAASRAGIKQGDIILQLNGKKVANVAELAEIVKTLPEGKPVPILIQRGNSPVFLAIRVED